MIATRCAALVAAALSILAAFGATDPDLQPSALRVAVTAVFGLLAPLFWPGDAATPARTASRIALWSAATAILAAVVLRVLGNPVQPLWAILWSCAMLMLIMLVTHAAAAVLEGRLRGPTDGVMDDARETAGRMVAMSLALLGAMPLWLGPLAELLSGDHPWVIDTVIGVSPLTHLAVASGNDLLRNQWLYQNSNLAVLPFSYPDLAGAVVSYVSVILALALAALAFRHRRRDVAHTIRIDPHPENTP